MAVKGAMDYIRRTYRVPAKRGGWVRFKEEVGGEFAKKIGRITGVRGGSGHLYVRTIINGKMQRFNVHPLDLEYLTHLPADWKPAEWEER